MIDFGIDKLAIIGAVALIVIGPERLPRVARTVGVLLGKAQRYVAQVQSEVSKSIELEELQKMRSGIQESVASVHQTMRDEMQEAESALLHTDDVQGSQHSHHHASGDDSYHGANSYITPSYAHMYDKPRKNWRVKRGATPIWYKQRTGVRRHVQSGAARVARFRPPGPR